MKISTTFFLREEKLQHPPSQCDDDENFLLCTQITHWKVQSEVNSLSQIHQKSFQCERVFSFSGKFYICDVIILSRKFFVLSLSHFLFLFSICHALPRRRRRRRCEGGKIKEWELIMQEKCENFIYTQTHNGMSYSHTLRFQLIMFIFMLHAGDCQRQSKSVAMIQSEREKKSN